ncbi:hypothetical protein [Bacillus sp. JJ1562]|uniref:hypothetical protein n=1 Tax=Bacillus sp. JJ1562 TaxID=3122960 RepID=UPI0030023B34
MFQVLTTLGSLIWNVVPVSVVATVGGSWETIVRSKDIYSNVIYVVLERFEE